MKTLLWAVLAGLPLAGCMPWEERVYSPAVNPVSPADVAGMAKAGYSDAMILDMVLANGVARRPSADDLVAMKDVGASDRVIAATLEAPVTVPRPATETRIIYRDSYYCYPPPYVSLGYGYWGGYRRCR